MANLGRQVDLDAVARRARTSYEPELFPGLTWRPKNTRIIVLVFKSGKMILTGGSNATEIKKIYEKFILLIE